MNEYIEMCGIYFDSDRSYYIYPRYEPSGSTIKTIKVMADVSIAKDGTLLGIELGGRDMPSPNGISNKWHPIETAPKDGTAIIVPMSDGDVKLCRWGQYNDNQDKSDWFEWDWSEPIETPDVWMPLPDQKKKDD